MNTDVAREVQEAAIKNTLKVMVEDKAITVEEAAKLEESLLKNDSVTSVIETQAGVPVKKGGK